jgi:hypothetical protein
VAATNAGDFNQLVERAKRTGAFWQPTDGIDTATAKPEFYIRR